MVCTKCGHHNPDDSHFCANCGSPLEEDTTLSFSPTELEEDARDDLALSLSELSPGQALLVVKRGPNAGSKFLLDQEATTLGRYPHSDIFLDDVTVSRQHARIRREEGKFYVEDAGSLNGTYVNRRRVDSTQLANGDELQIGKFKLNFYAGE